MKEEVIEENEISPNWIRNGREENLTPIPIYVIDMDKPPKERWTKLIEDKKDIMVPMFSKLKEEENKFPWFIRVIMRYILYLFWYFFIPKEVQEEVDAIAKIIKPLGVPKIDVIMLNTGYDLVARCTSIIAQHPKFGNVVHFRTMDWDADEMRVATVNLIIMKGNKPIARATTWPGFVGFFTAAAIGDETVHRSSFSLSINYRKTEGGDWQYICNFYNMIIGSSPLALAIRHSIFHSANYYEAYIYLSKVRLISPCYIILAGSERDEGVLMTRNRRKTQKRRFLNASNYLIQTNIDHWIHKVNPYWAEDDALLHNSVDRRLVATQFFEHFFYDRPLKIDRLGGKDGGHLHPAPNSFDPFRLPLKYGKEHNTIENNLMSPQIAFDLLCEKPIFNGETIYGVYMEPAENNYYSFSFAKI